MNKVMIAFAALALLTATACASAPAEDVGSAKGVAPLKVGVTPMSDGAGKCVADSSGNEACASIDNEEECGWMCGCDWHAAESN
jgi:hypothetical protein